MSSLGGKVALVTGAGGGIGRSVARSLAAANARFIVSDLVQESGEGTVEFIKSSGGEAVFIACYVSDSTSVGSLFEGIVARYGRLDWAHNNAGIDSAFCSIAEMDEATFDRSLAVARAGSQPPHALSEGSLSRSRALSGS
jgi:NAD(P)-dependent dehydrogenase (short-subunit alcohol dehydrogenase family)